MKRVIIVHGWDGYPGEGWFPWLAAELKKKGYEVIVPQMPSPEEPRIKKWVPALREAAGMADEHTIFVGHSMGCQTILRYLAGLPEGARAGGTVFVAGFTKRLTNLEDDETVRSVAQEWLTTPLDLAAARPRIGKSVAIFSDNDPYVPLENKDAFAALGSRIIVEHGMGHFSGSTGTKELPAALEAVEEVGGGGGGLRENSWGGPL